MNRIFKYVLMFALIGIAIFALNQMSDGAEAADCTWKPTSGVDASTAANWENGSAPVDTDVIYFDDTSLTNCNWNIGAAGDNPSMFIVKSTYTGTITIASNVDINNLNNAGLITVNTGKILSYNAFAGYYYYNTGTISGAGIIKMILWNTDRTINPGSIMCDLTIDYVSWGGSGNQKITLTGPLNDCGDIIIQSSHATYTATLAVSGYRVHCDSISLGTRGAITFGNGNLELDTGTSNIGTSAIYNLYVNGTQTFSSSITISNILELNSKWTGRIYYNGTLDISTNQQHWTGWLYTQNDIAIEYNAYAYLAFQHDEWLGIQLESWSGTDNFTWNATSVASQTVQWSWSRGESSAMYDEYQDGIYIGNDETNAGGMGTFTNTFVGSHAILISRSSFLPASTDISDDVWLGIVFMSIATLITLFGYVRRIGLVMIISFLLLVIGTLASTQIWVELWTLPTLFILVNAVLMIHGMLRKV